MKYQWSREQKWNWVRVSIVSARTCRRTQIVISAWRPITRASCRRRAGTVVPKAAHFGDLITADYKILSEESESRNNHRVVTILPVQNKIFPGDREEFTKVPRAVTEAKGYLYRQVRGTDKETKSHLQWEFFGICQDMCGKNQLTYQKSNIILFLRKTYRDYISLVQKFCQVYSLDMRCTRRNLERRRYGCRHWWIGADGRVWTPRKKAQCWRSVNADERWQFYFPSRRWNSQNFLEEINVWDHPP